MKRHIILCVLLLILSAFAATQSEGGVHPDFLKAQKLESEGNFDDAISIYRRLYSEEGTDIYFWRLILLYERAGRFNDLADFARERLASHPGDTESTRYLARALYGQGKREKGRRLLIERFEQDGRSVQMGVFAANELINQGEYDEALNIYQLARQAAGDNALFALESARVYEAIEKYIPAIEEYLKIIDTVPAAYQRIENLISEARASGVEQQEILRLFEAYLESMPASIKAARLLSGMLYSDGKYREALKILGGPAAKSDSPSDIRSIADRLVKDDVIDVALEAYEMYARLFPDAPDRPEILLKSADLAGKLNRNKTASDYLEIVINDYSSTIHAARASIKMITYSKDTLVSKQYSEMLVELAETTEFREAAFEAYHTLGESYLRDNRPDDAKDAFTKAAIKARSKEERFALAVSMARQAFFTGDNETMAQEIHTAIRNNPQSSEINELLGDKVLGMRCAKPVDVAAFRMYTEGRFALYRGDIPEAIDKFTSTADTSTVVAATAAIYLGDLSRIRGEKNSAIEWYRHAINTAHDTTEIISARLKIADIMLLSPDSKVEAREIYLNTMTEYPGTVYDQELRMRLKAMVE